MRQPPRARGERLLSGGILLRAYGRWGVLEALAGFLTYGVVLWDGGWRLSQPLAIDDPLYGRAVAAFFAAVIVCQVANVMIWRTTRQSVLTKGIGSNRAVLLGIAVELLLLVVIAQTEPGHVVFGTASLPWWAWLLPVPGAAAMLTWAELEKRHGRRAPSAGGNPPRRPNARPHPGPSAAPRPRPAQ